MDSAAVHSRNADRDGDMISGLDDDVLLHILGLAADATDAARMGAVSRRWLGLWARVPALRFASGSPAASSTGTAAEERCAALTRYVSFVNGVLARRRSSSARSGCSAAAIESLEISCTTRSQQLEELVMPALIGAAQGWIRHASQQGLKRFILDLDCYEVPLGLAAGKLASWKELVVELLDELAIASPPRLLETMRLALGGARLRLPATAAAAVEFASLRDLSLERVTIADGGGGGGHLLGCLVSAASCPRLQKLRLIKVWLSVGGEFKEELRLEAGVLSELWMEEVHSVSLELRTPSLRVLHIADCIHNKAIRISAPRLEQAGIFFPQGRRWPGCLGIDDGDSPPCMRRLKLPLWSHRYHGTRYGEFANHSSTLLLNHYSSITCLDVTLYHKVFQEPVDLIEGRIPHLPHITSLTVNVSLWFERHDFGRGVANLLTRFSNLRHLSLHLPCFHSLHCHNVKGRLGPECNHQDYWTSHGIFMDHLQEVELSGLTGTDCELWFMKAVLTSAKGLRKVAIGFNPKCWQHQGKMDAFKRMLLDQGMQTTHHDVFMLHACKNL